MGLALRFEFRHRTTDGRPEERLATLGVVEGHGPLGAWKLRPKAYVAESTGGLGPTLRYLAADIGVFRRNVPHVKTETLLQATARHDDRLHGCESKGRPSKYPKRSHH